MKKLFCIVLAIALLACCMPASAASQYGVLSIPAQGISVALYDSASQETVDTKNSAAHFYAGSYIIADHCNQEFRALKHVSVGDTATIYCADGSTLHLVCVDKYNGKNTGKILTDQQGRNVMADHDYLMYTCRGKGLGWQRIVITQWVVVE